MHDSNLVEYDGTTDLLEHLYQFKNVVLRHCYTDGVKCCVFLSLELPNNGSTNFPRDPFDHLGSFGTYSYASSIVASGTERPL